MGAPVSLTPLSLVYTENDKKPNTFKSRKLMMVDNAQWLYRPQSSEPTMFPRWNTK